MQLNTLKPKHEAKAKRPRVGRGGKRGTTAGKGTKGQKARSGHRIRPALREYIQRLPKLRGYANKPVSAEATAVSLSSLAKVKGGVVTAATLREAGFIRSESAPVKILSNGEISTAVTVKGIKVSAAAKAKIEKAGGKVE